MNVLIRCDASPQLGFGHVFRTRVLADALAEIGVGAKFASRTPTAVAEILDGSGFEVVKIAENLDFPAEAAFLAPNGRFIVTDLQETPESYQIALRQAGCELLVIDGSRKTPCHGRWLLDPKPAPQPDRFESHLRTRSDTEYLAGPRYALYEPGEPCAEGETIANQVLISTGGGNDRGSIAAILRHLDGISRRLRLRVQTRSNNPRLGEIRQQAARSRHQVDVIVDEPLITAEAARSRAAILAGGVSCYQIGSMGIPFLLVPIAENQRISAEEWQSLGIGVDVGDHPLPDGERLCRELEHLLDGDELHQTRSARAVELCDGQGARRVAAKLGSAASAIVAES